MKHMAVARSLFAALILGGFVCAWAALPARADEWSKTYTLSGKPDLRVDTSDANIHVSTWDQNTIEAKVTTMRYKIGDDGIRIEEHQTGNQVEIDVRYPHNHGITVDWGNHGSHRVDIEVRMPREGRVDLHTGDGKIELGNFKGEMQLRSGDGSQELDGVDGKLRALTGDGHIRANGRFDELDLKTGDGHVEARATAGSALATGWRLESGDGTVTLEVPENLAADVDLHTGDGHIDLDVPVTTEGKIREGEVRGKLNGGGNLLVIHTGDGSIRLRKS
jgi:Putative adhesin